MSMPYVALPWSHNPLATAAPIASSAPGDAPTAAALFSAGYVASAIAIADASDDPELRDQGAFWRQTLNADAAVAALIGRGAGALVPSASVRRDGAPRFVLTTCGAEDAATAIDREHVGNGADAELRLFLDDALRDGDRYVDVEPAAGFAVLSAATAAAAVSAVALCADAAQRDALVSSAKWSDVSDRVTIHVGRALTDISLSPPAAGRTTIVHVGSAAAVAPAMASIRSALERREIGAVAWRCGTAAESSLDAEHLQVAAAVLGVFGFQHFALAQGVDGLELVPAEVMASNEMIFSLEAGFLAQFAG